MCELLHTSLVVQKTHVVDRAGIHYRRIVTGDRDHKSRPSPDLAAGASFLFWPLTVWGLGNQPLHAASVYSKFRRAPEAQAIFCRRRHQPRRPALAMSVPTACSPHSKNDAFKV